MSHGIVVRHKETGNVYAVSQENYNPQVEEKVRDLYLHESVLSFPHKANVEITKPARGKAPAHAKAEAEGK